MRKRRRLANKMTIMVCAVLIAVSAFFYVPMDSYASGVSDFEYSISGSRDVRASDRAIYWSASMPFVNQDLQNDSYYRVSFDYKYSIDSLKNFLIIYSFVRYDWKPFTYFHFNSSDYVNTDSIVGSSFIIAQGSSLESNCSFAFDNLINVKDSQTLNFNFSYNITSITPLTGEESLSYENGYNAGYSAGEEVGESNGYSSGYSDGFEAGEQNGYDTGFQAGSDSVDTQSYYDMGYSAGYDAGYASGYDTGYDDGYDAGWSAYEAQMGKWGADTSDYPLLIEQTDGTFDLQFDFIQPARVDDVISDYCDIGRYYSGIDFNPNHTYRLDFTYHDFEYDYSDSYFTAAYSFWLYWGSCSFPITVGTKDDITSSFYISGDQIGTGLKFRCDVSGLEAYSEYFGVLHYYINDCTLKLYDMGPSGDTQNHIANQTDQLTNGYDDSKGNQVNSDLSTGLNDYETAENSLFATATTGMRDFAFFDFESVPAMITGMSFIGSIMGSWFNQAGGASGVGIVLSILFSVILVAMVLGLYRWYQSRGGKN